MKRNLNVFRWTSLSLFILVLAVAPGARAADDTARFLGTWKAEFSLFGQSVAMISVHDKSGYKNYFIVSSGLAPVGDGQFSAANGRYKATAEKPNDAGTYRFTDDNTVICTNSANQTLTWKRYSSALPPVVLNAGYDYRTKPVLKNVLDAARKNVNDFILTYVEVQGVPNYWWLQYNLYSPSTGTNVGGWSGGPKDGQYSVGHWKIHDPDKRALPVDFKIDFADAMLTLRKAGYRGGLGVTRLEWAGARGTQPELTWSIRVTGGPIMVPLFIDAQSGKAIPWKRAMDPPNASDAQLKEIWDRILNRNQPVSGGSNAAQHAMECVADIQAGGNCPP
jgi:hypothetical protein